MTSPPPPRWASRLVTVVLRGDAREVVLGDLEERFRADLAQGMGRRTARRRYARAATGSVAAVLRDRFLHGPSGGEGGRMGFDELKRVVRRLGRRPAYALTVVGTLALGLGAATAVFSVVDGVLLRPLDLPHPEELVTVWMTQDGGEPTNLSGPNGLDLREETDAFAGMYLFSRSGVVLDDGQGSVRRILTLDATDGVLGVLGVAPVLGRDLRPGDLDPGAPRVALLSYGLWRESFGSDPEVVGRTVLMDGAATEIVGVVPEGLEIPLAPDTRAILPARKEGPFTQRDLIWLGGIARLAPGIDPARAQAEAEGVWSGLRERYPEVILDQGVTVLPLQAYLVADVDKALWVLLAATGLLLAMASVSVGGLLLARGRTRASELALRASLGAGRGRMLGELIAEGMVLTAAASLVGTLLARGLVAGMRAFGPADVPRLGDVAVDGRVLAFAVGGALVVGLITTLVPALRAVREAPARRLVQGGRGAVGRRGARRGRFSAVSVQVGLATLLLVGAGLLGRSFLSLIGVDPGYRVDGIVTARVELPSEGYADAEARRVVYRQALDRVRAEPGVVEAGWAVIEPLGEARVNYEVAVDGRAVAPPGEAPSADLQLASGGYFRALEIPLVEGRLFEEADIDGPPVALVTEQLANTLWGEASAVGHRIGWVVDRAAEPRWHDVVGVVGDVRQQSLTTEPRGTLILDALQRPQFGATLAVRVRSGADQVGAALRDDLTGLGPGIPQPEMSTLRAARSADVAPARFLALLLTLFAGAALTLAAVGTYATLAYATARRRVEWGVRLAVGADPKRLQRAVVLEGLAPVGVGMIAGSLAALLLGGLVRGLLFGVPARDPVAFALAAVVLGGAGLAACLLPAIRASRTDPVRSLRSG